MKLGSVYFPRLGNTSPAPTKSGGLSSVDQTPPQIQFAIVIALLPGHGLPISLSRGEETIRGSVSFPASRFRSPVSFPIRM